LILKERAEIEKVTITYSLRLFQEPYDPYVRPCVQK
jgi:hypothetical protein